MCVGVSGGSGVDVSGGGGVDVSGGSGVDVSGGGGVDVSGGGGVDVSGGSGIDVYGGGVYVRGVGVGSPQAEPESRTKITRLDLISEGKDTSLKVMSANKLLKD